MGGGAMRRARGRSPQTGAQLPTPPGRFESLSYVSAPQHRWLFALSAVVYVGVALSVGGFASTSPWAWVFFIPVALWGIEQAISLRLSTYRRVVTERSHRRLIAGYDPPRWPSIDVFLPSCGEPLEVLAHGFHHVAALDYPGALQVFVLDDSSRDGVRELAQRYGFRYLARHTSLWHKAGNIQYGFRHSSGDAILVLDADFVPRHDFLRHTVPYLGDPEVAIVQTPQYFDTSPTMGWLERTAGATQEFFFRFLQPSRDVIGAAICVGTSAIYRRSALDAVGGFPQISHSEDIFTSLRLSGVGWRLRYVPLLLSKGTCPADIDRFIGQQYRWCEGTLRLVTDPDFRLGRFSWRQRLCYWAGFLFYVTTAIVAVLAPVPALAMLWGMPYAVTPAHVLPLLGAVLMWLVVVPSISVGRWRPEVLRVQVIYSFAHLLCVLDLLRRHAEEWVPSGDQTQTTPVGRRVRRFMVPFIVLSQAGIVVGLAHGVWRYGIGAFWAAILFGAFGLYISVPIVIESVRRRRPESAGVPEGGDPRAAVRAYADPV